MAHIIKTELSNDQLLRSAPAAFTTEPRQEASDKYLFISTKEILNSLNDEGFVPVRAYQASVNNPELVNYASHMVELTHRDNLGKIELKQGFPLVRLRNNHSATKSFKADLGIYRPVCANGLVLPTSAHNSMRVIHNKDINHGDVINDIMNILNNFAQVQNNINEYRAIELTRNQQLDLSRSIVEEYFIGKEEILELNDKRGIRLEERFLKAQRYADYSNDLWTTLNIIQERVIRGGVRHLSFKANGDIKRASTRVVNSIERNTKLNQMIMSKVNDIILANQPIALSA